MLVLSSVVYGQLSLSTHHIHNINSHNLIKYCRWHYQCASWTYCYAGVAVYVYREILRGEFSRTKPMDTKQSSLERNMKHPHCGTFLIIMYHVLFVLFKIDLLSKCFVVKQITVDIIGIHALCVEIFMLPIYPANLKQVLTISQGKFTGKYI